MSIMSEPPDDDMWELEGDEQENQILADVEAEYAAHVEAHRAAEAIEEMGYDEETLPEDMGPLLPHAEEISSSVGSMTESPSRSSTSNSVDDASPLHGAAEANSTHQTSGGRFAANHVICKDISRKRLRGKCPRTGYYAEQESKNVMDSIAASLSHPAYMKYRKMSFSKRRSVAKAFYNRKVRFLQKLEAGPVTIGNETLRLHSGDGGHAKAALVLQWLKLSIKSCDLAEDMLGHYIAQTIPLDRQDYHRSTGQQMLEKSHLLLTWNGPWGLLFQLDHVPTEDDNLELLLPMVRARTERLWEQFREKMSTWAISHKATQYAQSLEICHRTLTRTGQVRVHLHAWFKFQVQCGGYREYVYPFEFEFKDSKPVPSKFHVGHQSRGHRSGFAGAFYVQVAKPGSIRQFCTLEMFHDYCPQASWITNMAVIKKITLKTAENLYVQCLGQAKQNVEQIRFVTSFLVQQKREAQRLKIENQIRGQQKPFKHIDAVTTWLEQYNEIRDRYLFLVLDGDSMYGKSRFAASLTTAEKFFLVDCASATEPELRQFDRDQHDVVCFDEAKPSMVIRVKKLAQAGVDIARLGQSATNQVSYQVWFHRVKLVICCNGWATHLNDMPPEDVAWLNKNSVYVKVSAPLFG